MKSLTIFLLLLLTGTVRLLAQTHSIASIDSLLQQMTADDQFSGAVLIADKSHVLLSKGYGYANRKKKF